MQDKWKFVDGPYWVSDQGRVKALERYMKVGERWHHYKERILKPSYRNGYLYVGLNLNGKVRTYPIHRLVAKAFVPNPDGKPEVDHIDGVRDNNVASNLRWVTKAENLNNPITMAKLEASGSILADYWKNRLKGVR